MAQLNKHKFIDREAATKNQEFNVEMAANIYAKYGDYIYSIIYANIGADLEADDVYQDFFLSLVHRPIPNNIDNIKSYIYRAVVNDILDMVRKNKSYKLRINKHAQLKKIEIGPKDLIHTVIKNEEVVNMLKIIDECLPKHEGQAVIQRYYNEKNMQAVAEELGINKRSLSRYLCTGVKKLKKLVNQPL
jgi:RNA polymerase sigma factor (sigma-70 family)